MDSVRPRRTYTPAEAPLPPLLPDPAVGSFAEAPGRFSPERKKPISRRRLWPWFFAPFLLLGTTALGLYFLAGITLTRSIHFENHALTFFQSLGVVGQSLLGSSQPLAGENDGRINILLLGRAGEHNPGKNLTDTVMIMSLDTRHKKVALFSLPRDLFVPIPGTETSTKLNSLYQIGLDEGKGASLLKESVALITGIPIHYYASIDFDGFEKVIDSLGGLQVDVVRDFHDPLYPGPNYSYETFDIKAGWQRLDGATALKYARERHNDPEGDFGRAKRQQQILQAFAKKALSLPTFVNPFRLESFLQSLGASITTDIAPQDLERFIEIGRTFDTQNISTVVADAWNQDSVLRVDHIDTPAGRAFILVPRAGNWSEVQTLAANLFSPQRAPELQDHLKTEAASIAIYTSPQAATAATALKNSLENEFSLAPVTISVLPALKNAAETAIIKDNTSLEKPFTLNLLLGQYAFTQTDEVPAVLPSRTTSADFQIFYTLTTFGETSSTPPSSQDDQSNDFQVPLAPQPTPRH